MTRKADGHMAVGFLLLVIFLAGTLLSHQV
jgi:hypothetical protein